MKHGHLTEQRKHFVEAYCMGHNATKAAKAAGYSIKTTHVQGSRMLRNVKILEHFNDFADTYVKDAGKGYPEVVDGYFYPPDKPGWGIEIDEDYIEKYPPNLSSAGIIADPGLNMFENNNWAKRGQD